MKLKVYQQGGGLIYTPFIPEQQAVASSTAGSRTTNSSDEDSKLNPLDKELLDLMKGQDLLPSDIQMIYNRLIQFQRKTQSLSSESGFGSSDSYRSVMPGMLQIMNLVSQAKYNKQADKDVISRMTSENAGNEFALDGYGRMYVQDLKSREIKKINPSEFDSEKHLPLSNSQLLYLRERNPELAFDGDVFEDMRNMVGMTSVSKEIDRIIKEFGTEEGQRYLSKETAQIFSDLNNPDGAYKLTMKVPSSGLKQAWKTIYDQLPINMQNLLKIRSAVSGDTPETYISDIVLHNSSTTQNIDYDATMSKAAGFSVGDGSSSSEKTTKDTYAERLVSGDGLDPEQWINIMPSNSGVVLNAYSQNAGPLLKEGNRLYNTNLQVALTQAEAVGGIVDAQSITFGDQLISPDDYTNIMVNNYVNMKRVYLPITYSEDGRVMPDFRAQQLLETVQDKLRNEQYSEVWINQWLEENLPNAHYNSQTKQVEFDKRYVRPFLVLNGIAAKNRVRFDETSPYLHHLSADEGVRLKDDYKRIVSEQTVGNKIEHVDGKGANRWKYYSGNIYLPISGQVIGAALYNDQYFPQETYTDITQRARANELRQNMKTNF